MTEEMKQRNSKILKILDHEKAETMLFGFLAIAGFAGAIFTRQLLANFSYNFGPPTIGLFIAPFFCSIYLTFLASRKQLAARHLGVLFILYAIQSIPFAPLLFREFKPGPNEDFERYCIYAKNMIDQGTLWGGDSLVYDRPGKHYMTQPGYRYLIAFEWLLFGKLYRFVSFLHIAISLLGIFFLQQTIQKVVSSRRLRLALSILIVSFTPYLVKNSLMGLPEWISVFLLMMAAFFYLVRQQEWIPVLALALIPFFRQNLLVTMLLFSAMIIARSRKKVQLIVASLLLILLPLYHNLYYARKWKFLVDIFEYPFIKYDAGEKPTAFYPEFLLQNIVRYFSFDYYQDAYYFSLIAVFIIYAVFLYFLLLHAVPGKNRIMYLIITGSAIGPSLLLGGGYYPRFEFVNTVIMMVTFLFLIHKPVFVRPHPDINAKELNYSQA